MITVIVVVLIVVLIILMGGLYLVVSTKIFKTLLAPKQLREDAIEALSTDVQQDVSDFDSNTEKDSLQELPEVQTPEISEPITLAQKLEKTRGFFRQKLAGLFKAQAFSQETFDEIEEALIASDVGLDLAAELVETLKTRVKQLGIKTTAELVNELVDVIVELLDVGDRSLKLDDHLSPNTWLVVGVNGSGKTTTIGKLAKMFSDSGHKVLLAAADTFRAAAIEQLDIWANKAGVEIVKGSPGGDAASVVYDAISKARAKGYDLVIADTAGRLHTKINLMEELKKIKRVADKDSPSVTEVLLILDGTTGQNGLNQAKVFFESLNVTGIIVTKLDGTAKGGVVISIAKTLKIPVKMIGVGEKQEDLVPFNPKEFVEAILR